MHSMNKYKENFVILYSILFYKRFTVSIFKLHYLLSAGILVGS